MTKFLYFCFASCPETLVDDSSALGLMIDQSPEEDGVRDSHLPRGLAARPPRAPPRRRGAGVPASGLARPPPTPPLPPPHAPPPPMPPPRGRPAEERVKPRGSAAAGVVSPAPTTLRMRLARKPARERRERGCAAARPPERLVQAARLPPARRHRRRIHGTSCLCALAAATAVGMLTLRVPG